MILRARTVLPISGPILHNGAIEIRGSRILAVAPWKEFSRRSERALDLGDVILLPGLVNAHCHLDYTDMAGQFPPPKVFTDWLKGITATKAGWTLADFKDSWRRGADMLLRSGTTTVGDIEAVPQLLPEAWKGTPLRVISFLEMIGITNRRPPRTVLSETLEKIGSLKPGRSRVGLSPHAPYSTVAELLRLSAQTARRRRWPLCIHVAESALEYAMFARGRGEMFAWLKRSGRDMTDCRQGSPIQHVERCGMLGRNLLVAHANYLGRKDAERLGDAGASVAHCPRSHAYFRHESFRWQRLQRAGVNICLGTDSLASVETIRRQKLELNLFEEMRALARREPSLNPKKILQMATTAGALALGMKGRVGELTPGAFADLIALPLREPAGDTYAPVLEHLGDVAASMIGGRWVIRPNAISK